MYTKSYAAFVHSSQGWKNIRYLYKYQKYRIFSFFCWIFLIFMIFFFKKFHFKNEFFSVMIQSIVLFNVLKQNNSLDAFSLPIRFRWTFGAHSLSHASMCFDILSGIPCIHALQSLQTAQVPLLPCF